MKLTDIITEKERIIKGDWFKRKYKPYCIRWNNDRSIFEKKTVECDAEKEVSVYNFEPDDLIADDWEWVKKKWDTISTFNQYKNGILCWVWNDGDPADSVDIIFSKKSEGLFKYRGYNKSWQHAKPVSQDEAPAIISRETASEA